MTYRNIWKAEETDSRLHLQDQLPKLTAELDHQGSLSFCKPSGSHLPNQEAAAPASGSRARLIACPHQLNAHLGVEALTGFVSSQKHVVRKFFE